MILLPDAGGELEPYVLSGARPVTPVPGGFESRIAYAAAHVVIDPLRTGDPLSAPVIDFDATLDYRRYLWSLGFRVAEAMDTAQRGMGLHWEMARELIRLTAAEASAMGAVVACGANTDQSAATTLDAAIAAYQEQCAYIEGCGAQVILMASRAVAATARGAADYERVYRAVLSGCSRPVILHWLGEAFDPALAGYWGGANTDEGMRICLGIIAENQRHVDGIKISLLDARREIEMRRLLPPGVRMYTGDDFNYPQLIEGDTFGYSDALLGIFDGIAPVAAAALQALDRGDAARYDELLGPTVPLSRHIFQAPTFFYKTGIVFLAYLNGHQNHFRMLGGQESMRSIAHLAELFRLADQAGLLPDTDLAMDRMRRVLALAGVA
ncbi:MAG TPA: dihydrodipicolinate synthase family protein [Solibacterales bacterium]|nr:dihydrodipicolinate synthase family protein [Bryobacterales bacterium]